MGNQQVDFAVCALRRQVFFIFNSLFLLRILIFCIKLVSQARKIYWVPNAHKVHQDFNEQAFKRLFRAVLDKRSPSKFLLSRKLIFRYIEPLIWRGAVESCPAGLDANRFAKKRYFVHTGKENWMRISTVEVQIFKELGMRSVGFANISDWLDVKL